MKYEKSKKYKIERGGGEIAEEKIKSSENINNLEVKIKMAYYCKLCQCYHYPGSKYYYAHRIYASQKHKPKEVVKRKPTKRWRW